MLKAIILYWLSTGAPGHIDHPCTDKITCDTYIASESTQIRLDGGSVISAGVVDDSVIPTPAPVYQQPTVQDDFIYQYK